MRRANPHFGAPEEIDFLPASFHLSRQRRKKAVWRRALLGVFLTLIVLGTVRQHQILRDRLNSRDRVRQQAAALRESLGDPAALQARLDRFEEQANLITQLRIRIAPTRLLAAVSASRPEFVAFHEFRMVREPVPASGSSASSSSSSANASDDDVRTPERKDLERLARQAEETALFVHLSGVAPDDVTLSHYLVALEETDLFDEVKLLVTDEYRYGENWLRSFRIRLRVRQPGAAATHAAAGATRA